MKKTLAECRKEEATYYEQAYEGFLKAIASENFPMCGMEESTVNLLMANIAYKLGKVDIASRFISMILTSQAASRVAKRPSDAFKRRDYCKTARQRIIYGWKILCGKKGKSSGNLYLMGCM